MHELFCLLYGKLIKRMEEKAMPYRDMSQYKVTRGPARTSGIKATYEYTSGNKVSKENK